MKKKKPYGTKLALTDVDARHVVADSLVVS